MTHDASAPKRRREERFERKARSARLRAAIASVLKLNRELDWLQWLLAADLPAPSAKARLNEARLIAVSALLRDTLHQLGGPDPLGRDIDAAFDLATEQALIHRLVRRHRWTVTAPGVIERRPTGDA